MSGVVGVVAVLVGLVHVFPDLLFAHWLGDRFQGIGLWAANDEALYLTRVSRVVAGQWICSNPMIFEHRHDPWLYPPLGELIEGLTGRVLGLSVTQLDWLFTFLGPAVFCWVSYQLLRRLLTSRPLAWVGSLILSLGYDLVAKVSPLWQLRLVNPDRPVSLQLVRPISEQIHYPFFMLALLACFLMWDRPSIRRGALAGVALGATFYLTHFYWTYCAAGVVMLAAWSALRKDQARLAACAACLGVAAVIAIPFVINGFGLLAHPAYRDLAERLGPTVGRRPIAPPVHVAMTAAFFLAYRWLAAPRASFIGAFLLGGWVCLNVQVITGFTVQAIHWETLTNKPVLIMALLLVTDHWAARAAKRPWGRLIAVGLGGVVFLHAALLQGQYYLAHRDRFAALQPLGRPAQWLKQHTDPDAVIVTHPIEFRRAEYLTVLTQRYTYISEPHLPYALVPQQELEDRYLAALAWFHVNEEDVRAFIRKGYASKFLGLKAIPYYGGAKVEDFELYFRGLEERYLAARAEPFATLMANGYKVDYLLATLPEWMEIPDPTRQRLDIVYQDEAYVIARIR